MKDCGGCDPAYDRVAYVRTIQAAAGDRIEWVSPEAGGFNTLVIVTGCEKACIEQGDFQETGWRIVSLRDDQRPPEEVVSLLLGTEEGEKT